MASLLTSSEISCVTGAAGDLFDTFKRSIIVFKEPKQVITPATAKSSSVYYGYQSKNAKPDAVTSFVVVSGSFEALISHRHSQKTVAKQLGDLNTLDRKHGLQLKVKSICRDYINQGRTENVEVDGQKFNLVNSDKIQEFLGFTLYVFDLEEIK